MTKDIVKNLVKYTTFIRMPVRLRSSCILPVSKVPHGGQSSRKLARKEVDLELGADPFLV